MYVTRYVSLPGAVYAWWDMWRLPEEEGFKRDSAQAELLTGTAGSDQRQGRTRLHTHPGLQTAAGCTAGPGLTVPEAGPR